MTTFDRIASLVQSANPNERIEGFHLARQASDANLVVQLNGLLDELGPPDDVTGADAFWGTSNLLTRRCFILSPHPAAAHVDQLDEDAAVAVTSIFLATADGSAREAEFLEELLPVALPTLGLEALNRQVPAAVRARLFAHLIEQESNEGVLGGPATLALSNEPMDIVTLANEIIQTRSQAALSGMLGDLQG
jgi:hypothetical protein